MTPQKLQALRERCDNAERRGPNVIPYVSTIELREVIAELEQRWERDLINRDDLFVCGQIGANVTRVYTAEPAPQPAHCLDCMSEAHCSKEGCHYGLPKPRSAQPAHEPAPPVCALCTADGQCMHRSKLCIIQRPRAAKEVAP